MVTGATGFIGYHLLKELENNAVQIYAVCRSGSANIERIQNIKNLHMVNCDIEELDQLPQLCQERNFDVCYHLAWRGASGEERSDSVIQAENIVWNLKLPGIAQQMKIKKLVVTGTVCENQCDAIVSQNYTGKSAYYLLAKRMAYQMLRIECRKIGLPLVWCMFYHPIGKYNKPEQIIMNTILKLQKGESPKFGPADKWFDVIAVQDLCRGLYLAGETELRKDRYFIGSGVPRKLKEYLLEVQEIVNPNVELQIGAYQDDGLPMKREWLDGSEFVTETGFVCREELKKEILLQCNSCI